MIRIGPNWAIVLDGHSTFGLEVATAVGDAAEQMLNTEQDLDDAVLASVARDVIVQCGGVLAHGGTTFTSVQVRGSMIRFDWVGDSSGYVVCSEHEKDYRLMWHTDDHEPTRADEAKRVLEKGGECVYLSRNGRKYPLYDKDGVLIDYANEPVAVALAAYWKAKKHCEENPDDAAKEKLAECLRTYQSFGHGCAMQQFSTKNKMGDLATYLETPNGRIAMTRSFGDLYALEFGLSNKLQTHTVDVGDMTGVAFAASDGVHDCFTRDEIASLMLNVKSDDELMAAITKRSHEVFPKPDDISFVRTFF